MPYVSHKRSRVSRKSFRRPKSRFHKKVARVIRSSLPIKTNTYHQSQTGLPVNLLTQVGINLFKRISTYNAATGFGGYYVFLGGAHNAVNNTTVGDPILGNVIYPKTLMLRGVLRNYLYSPDTTVRFMLIRWAQGIATPTFANLWMGLTSCKLVDTFCWTNYTLIAQKDFYLKTAKVTGTHYLPQSKPTGTGTNDATGTYWTTPGVSVVGNTNNTYTTENLVYFNANTMAGSFAEHTLPFTWKIPLQKKIPKVTYNEGLPTGSNLEGNVAAVNPSDSIKDWNYGLFAYCYGNALQGSSPVLNSASLDELTYQLHFTNPG